MINRIKAALGRKREPVVAPPAFVPPLPDPRAWVESLAASFPDPREWAESLAASLPAPDALVPTLPDPQAFVPALPDPRAWATDFAASLPDAHGIGATHRAALAPQEVFRDIELDLCEPALAHAGIVRLAAALEAAPDTRLADLVIANGRRFFDYYEGMAATTAGRPYLRGAAEAFASVVCTAYEHSTGQVPQAWAQRAATIEPPGFTLG